MKQSAVIVPGSTVFAAFELGELPLSSLFVGVTAFVFARLVSQSRAGRRWHQDIALTGILLLGVVLTVLGDFSLNDEPLGRGMSFLVGSSVGWGGMRSLELFTKAGTAAWRAIIEAFTLPPGGDGGQR